LLVEEVAQTSVVVVELVDSDPQSQLQVVAEA
jgi:hypothetical protein